MEYQGVILAAGRGTRMGAFSDVYPKPLLPVCNKPLIVYQIELLRELGIRDITILIGHKGYRIAETLGDGRSLDVRLRYVEQNEMLGIAHALGTVERFVERPFMLFLGDIFFHAGDLSEMFRNFESQDGGGVLATKLESDPDAIRRNFSVTLDDGGFVTRVIEKPRHTHNRLKGVGLYLFDLTIFDAIRRTPRTAMRDEYEITDAIQVMIGDGYPVRPANVILDDVNVTNPTDLLELNLREQRNSKSNNLIGNGCDIHPEARIDGSIIGDNVQISQPASVVDSVIFDGTHIDKAIPIERSVVLPDMFFSCGAELTKHSQ